MAAKIALQTAGAIGGVPGSPTPVGGPSAATMCTSTVGIALMRSARQSWKLDSPTLPFSNEITEEELLLRMMDQSQRSHILMVVYK